jgi:hypothetical protein
MAEIAKDSDAKLGFHSENFDQDKYSAVARSARLYDVALTKQNFEVKLAVMRSSANGDTPLKHSFKGSPEGWSIDEATGLMVGRYLWKAGIVVGRAKGLALTAEYLLIYRGLAGQDKDYARLYFEKLGRFTSYPYFRMLFSSCAGNAGLTLPPLPSLTDRVD